LPCLKGLSQLGEFITEALGLEVEVDIAGGVA
jgi:hypothetical protein